MGAYVIARGPERPDGNRVLVFGYRENGMSLYAGEVCDRKGHPVKFRDPFTGRMRYDVRTAPTTPEGIQKLIEADYGQNFLAIVASRVRGRDGKVR